MPTAIVTIIIMGLMVMGGMAMSQGILSSADAAALSVEEIGVREGEMMRTEVNTIRAAELSWADLLRVRVDNSGQTKLAGFSKWDCIVNYYDSGGTYHTEWLPYTEGTLGDNEWQQAAIWLNGQPEFFEPGIVNSEEELVILAKLSPLPGDATEGEVIIATPNGIRDSFSFYCPGYTRLTPHSENMTIVTTDYYELVEAATADGAAMTETTNRISRNQTGWWLLHNQDDSSRDARHLFPLTGISQIPAGTWTVYYRGMAEGWWWGGFRGDAYLNINICIRRADGSIRQYIAWRVADAVLSDYDNWETVSGTYYFPGYTVVDDTDYLEISYNGESTGWGAGDRNSYIRLMIDDDSLDETEQTRIVAL